LDLKTFTKVTDAEHANKCNVRGSQIIVTFYTKTDSHKYNITV